MVNNVTKQDHKQGGVENGVVNAKFWRQDLEEHRLITYLSRLIIRSRNVLPYLDSEDNTCYMRYLVVISMIHLIR